MRMSQLLGRRIKEVPKDAQTVSHQFLIRGGYIRMVSTGIYSLLPIAKRITSKIEKIVREEMNAIEGQEVMMPVVLSGELWEESGRYEKVGPELLRFRDRNDKKMVLGMTHEEAVCHLARTELNSYRQLPFMVYQIQTKYRDEARPRAGLIRTREFTMKDAYSFHESQECLESYYQRAHEAYVRIFKRLGMKDVISIQSDTGMMGGSLAHEFMALVDIGEDTIFMSPDGSYQANKEVATTALKFDSAKEKPLEKVHTPGQKTIEEVSQFLKVSPAETGKAVFYASGETIVFVVIRGDIEVNEAKLKGYLKSGDLRFANDDEIRKTGAVPGYASPLDIKHRKGLRILFDRSVAESSNLVVGANEEDYHYVHFNYSRDLGELKQHVEVADIATARAGDPCPVTGAPLEEKRGVELGNIFQLGTDYSDSMKVEFLDQNGKSQSAIMGCYGLGIERSMASIVEMYHDEYGPIWPEAVAPWQVHICALNIKKDVVAEAAERFYQECLKRGIEVVFDDRNEKPGFMFNDADLMGVPHRVIFSPKTLAEGKAEYKRRDGSEQEKVDIDGLMEFLEKRVAHSS